eukprot:TRINITY_DN30567_c1_g1_i1.p1 TRINITY_DN30567_c1_g1~~TRINITY_DN30567_c1_g1_i1.p1  ORF type:complete len:191 (+),score=16.36 TRINITY_DN30567_c1_g1_i1:29-601(+)
MSKKKNFHKQSPRGFFWSGVLLYNKDFDHSFFDIKSKKKTSNGQTGIYLISRDVPPLPILSPETTLKANFFLENTVGTAPIRHRIASAKFMGIYLQNQTGQEISLRVENAEWKFVRVPKNNSSNSKNDENDNDNDNEDDMDVDSNNSNNNNNNDKIKKSKTEVELTPWFLVEIKVRITDSKARDYFAISV